MKKNTSSNYSGIIFLILILIAMPLLEPYLKSNDTSSLIMLFVIIFGLGSFLHLIGNRKSIFQIGGSSDADSRALSWIIGFWFAIIVITAIYVVFNSSPDY